MLILHSALGQFGQSWRALCWMLPPKSGVSPRITRGNLKPCGGMNSWTKLYERCVHYSKPTVPWREAKTSHIDVQRVAKHAVWLAKSEAEKEVFATVYPEGDGVFRIAKQMDRTNQDIVSENCVHNDAGELVLTYAHSTRWTWRLSHVTQACETELPKDLHFSSCLNGVHSGQNTHHSCDAESCWWGRNWDRKTTDRGCFQLSCDHIRLGEELQSEPL